MNMDLLLMALLVGAANYAFRVFPVKLMRKEPAPGGLISAFLASTGPAAIATLVVASILPQLYPIPRDVIALLAGVGVTIAAFLPGRSVVGATLAGSTAYGLAFWLTS